MPKAKQKKRELTAAELAYREFLIRALRRSKPPRAEPRRSRSLMLGAQIPPQGHPKRKGNIRVYLGFKSATPKLLPGEVYWDTDEFLSVRLSDRIDDKLRQECGLQAVQNQGGWIHVCYGRRGEEKKWQQAFKNVLLLQTTPVQDQTAGSGRLQFSALWKESDQLEDSPSVDNIFLVIELKGLRQGLVRGRGAA